MVKPLKNKNVIVGVCGGIAAYKSCEIVRLLVKESANVHCILTRAGEKFITPLTLQTLSGNPVHTDMFSLIDAPQKNVGVNQVGHISLADKADVILVAPATADIIAKLAIGICDELLSCVILASKAKKILAPSMNVNMWENKITQDNIAKLKNYGFKIINPAEGDLACGCKGTGRLPNPEEIVNKLKSLI